MPFLRRRSLPEELVPAAAAFDAVLDHVEAAKEEAAGAVPTGRFPGRPLAEAVYGFSEHVEAARDGMDAWRTPETEGVWQACSAGLEVAAAAGETLRLADPPEGFEPLLTTIGELIAALDPFEDAAERFLELRR